MDGYIIRARNINQTRTETIPNASTLEAIYNQYYQNVYNYVRFRVNDRFYAEELASSVFENAMRKFSTYKPSKSPMEAWLIGIAKNVVTDFLRQGRRRTFVPLESIEFYTADGKQPEEVAIANEESQELLAAMEKLGDKERQILAMKFSTDLKHSEIAQVLGVSENSVGVTVYRSVKKLRSILEKGRGADGR